MGRSSIPDWAPYRRMSPLLWLWFVIRSTWVMTVLDNPLSWFLGFRGAKNRFDDIEGPFFLQGAPGVQVDEGQAVLSSTELFNKFDPFLLVLEVKDTNDSSGTYYFFSWTLRGKMITDGKGRVEHILVRPGDYFSRAAHIHMRIQPANLKHNRMTTQTYLCTGNDPVHMSHDVANKFRPRPDGNMAICWATEDPKDGKSYFDLPKLPQEDVDMADAINRWNAKLKEQGLSKNIKSVGRHQIKLTAY
ncbi:hypothetical protein BD309DRAFT_1079516 [Dichomitus squalens]|nr:hypothetical protein BD309DRAFT_1079516 [Dichomitus squalens]